MSGGQVMVVVIVALVMLAGIIKSAILADRGENGRSCGSRRKHKSGAAEAERDNMLAELNARLDTVIERLAVLEKIVVDEDRDLRRKFADLDARENRPSA